MVLIRDRKLHRDCVSYSFHSSLVSFLSTLAFFTSFVHGTRHFGESKDCGIASLLSSTGQQGNENLIHCRATFFRGFTRNTFLVNKSREQWISKDLSCYHCVVIQSVYGKKKMEIMLMRN